MLSEAPFGNDFGSGLVEHGLKLVVKFTAGSRVLAEFTPHSGTPTPPTSPSPTFFTETVA